MAYCCSIRGSSAILEVEMKINRVIYCFVLFILLAGCAGETGSVREKEPAADQKNEQVQNERIVATTLAIAEIMDQLELDLVGAPTTSFGLPERYKETVEVGNPMQPDMEIISTLNPDKVLSVTTLEYDLKDSFKQAGVEADFLNLQGVEEMMETIKELGVIYHREEQAEAIFKSIESKIKEIQKETEKLDSPKVLILLGIPGSYLVATEHSYVGNLVETVGGENAIKGQSEEYISANTEYLHEADADIILRLSHGMPEEVVEMFNEEFATNDIWKHFKAVKNDRVYDLKEPTFATTANLNVIKALEELSTLLYDK